jgi:putative addiction module component (TIGR02574 family)
MAKKGTTGKRDVQPATAAPAVHAGRLPSARPLSARPSALLDTRAVFGFEIFKIGCYPLGMSMTVEQIAAEALSLPSEARALLADKLVESLDPAEGGLIRQLWASEAKRRIDDVRSGRVQTIPGDEALARVRSAVAR